MSSRRLGQRVFFDLPHPVLFVNPGPGPQVFPPVVVLLDVQRSLAFRQRLRAGFRQKGIRQCGRGPVFRQHRSYLFFGEQYRPVLVEHLERLPVVLGLQRLVRKDLQRELVVRIGIVKPGISESAFAKQLRQFALREGLDSFLSLISPDPGICLPQVVLFRPGEVFQAEPVLDRYQQSSVRLQILPGVFKKGPERRFPFGKQPRVFQYAVHDHIVERFIKYDLVQVPGIQVQIPAILMPFIVDRGSAQGKIHAADLRPAPAEGARDGAAPGPDFQDPPVLPEGIPVADVFPHRAEMVQRRPADLFRFQVVQALPSLHDLQDPVFRLVPVRIQVGSLVEGSVKYRHA